MKLAHACICEEIETSWSLASTASALISLTWFAGTLQDRDAMNAASVKCESEKQWALLSAKPDDLSEKFKLQN